MINSADQYTVSRLLYPPGEEKTYIVPRYQREYMWSKSDWELLFDDVLDNESGYYVGSIVCINRSTDSNKITELELVDGQQRLTTLSLLLAAIFNMLRPLKHDMNDDQLAEWVHLKYKLVWKDQPRRSRIVLQNQNNNGEDYKAVLSEAKLFNNLVDTPKYAGNRRIFKAYRYFEKRLEEISSSNDNKLIVVLDFLNKIGNACVVKIEVSNTSDAYILFESLNNRGMALSAVDLIKNKLLAKLDSNDQNNFDDYYNQWTALLENLGDKYFIQERFLRQNYNAFRGKLESICNVPIATRSNLIKIYDSLIENDAELFLRKISYVGKVYSQILTHYQTPEFNSLKNPLTNLERIQGVPSYVLLLYLMVKREDHELHMHHLNDIIDLLVRYFVRRNLTDTPPTRDLTKLFMEIIDNLDGSTGDDILQRIKIQLVKKNNFASNNLFKKKLNGPIYDENTNVTRFILCAIEEQGMTRETEVDLWRLENGKLVWTIEHIFPQGEKIPQSWIDMIADGDKEKAVEIQNEFVHQLGNLTITGYNSELGNNSFIEKRDRMENCKLVGYRNGLNLNEDMKDAETWGVKQIEKRTKRLVQKAMEIFKIE